LEQKKDVFVARIIFILLDFIITTILALKFLKVSEEIFEKTKATNARKILKKKKQIQKNKQQKQNHKQQINKNKPQTTNKQKQINRVV
jgi:hypothetical protein